MIACMGFGVRIFFAIRVAPFGMVGVHSVFFFSCVLALLFRHGLIISTKPTVENIPKRRCSVRYTYNVPHLSCTPRSSGRLATA